MFNFDGANKLITINSGVTSFDAQDMYSEWKNWVLANPINAAWLPAFRTVGGDSLTPGIKAGAYYFIANNYGWRIKPPEEDCNIVITGNLAPEDSAQDIFIPTTGAYTAAIIGLQPITQNVSDLLTIQEEALYNGTVNIDTVYGVSGTTFPNGTASQPVNNLADALTIADFYGFTNINLKGQITLTRDFVGWTFEGGSAEDNDRIVLNGHNVNHCKFTGMHLEGTGSGTIEAQMCCFDHIAGLSGMFRQCGFENDATALAGAGGEITLTYCHSEVPGTGKPTFDFSGLPVQVSIRAWAGGLNIKNFSHPGAAMTIDLLSGSIRLDSTCTAGEIVLRGVGDFSNFGTITPTTKGFISGEEIQLARKILQNRQYTNPATSKLEVWNDDETAIELEADLFGEDGTTPWTGSGGINKRSKLQ